MPHRRTLVTGFLGFGRFAENPSALLAQMSGRPFELIEVSYAAVDAFLDRLDAASFDRLLMLGVAGGSATFRVERLGRNRHGALADVRGFVPVTGAIECDCGDQEAFASTLWCEPTLAALPGNGAISMSDDAGDYLCNYALCRALRRFPSRRVGFLHVPPVEAVPIERQRETLAAILRAVEYETSDSFNW